MTHGQRFGFLPLSGNPPLPMLGGKEFAAAGNGLSEIRWRMASRKKKEKLKEGGYGGGGCLRKMNEKKKTRGALM